MTQQELKWAQKSLYNGSRQIADAGMLLEDTKYEKYFQRLWSALEELNTQLVRDIND